MADYKIVLKSIKSDSTDDRRAQRTITLSPRVYSDLQKYCRDARNRHPYMEEAPRVVEGPLPYNPKYDCNK